MFNKRLNAGDHRLNARIERYWEAVETTEIKENEHERLMGKLSDLCYLSYLKLDNVEDILLEKREGKRKIKDDMKLKKEMKTSTKGVSQSIN